MFEECGRGLMMRIYSVCRHRRVFWQRNNVSKSFLVLYSNPKQPNSIFSEPYTENCIRVYHKDSK